MHNPSFMLCPLIPHVSLLQEKAVYSKISCKTQLLYYTTRTHKIASCHVDHGLTGTNVKQTNMKPAIDTSMHWLQIELNVK